MFSNKYDFMIYVNIFGLSNQVGQLCTKSTLLPFPLFSTRDVGDAETISATIHTRICWGSETQRHRSPQLVYHTAMFCYTALSHLCKSQKYSFGSSCLATSLYLDLGEKHRKFSSNKEARPLDPEVGAYHCWQVEVNLGTDSQNTWVWSREINLFHFYLGFR